MKKIGAKFISAVVLAAVLLSGCGGKAEPSGQSGTEKVTEGAAETKEATETKETAETTETKETTVTKETAAQETATAEKGEAEPLKAAAIYEKIKSSYELPEMYEADDEWLMNYYGIDAAKLSDYVFAEADEVHADRVIILTVADEKDLSDVEKKLNAVLEQMNSPEMLDYLPDQADIIKAARINKNANTLYLVISPDAKGIEEIIENGLLGR
ncbi:MAG: DUF4358 domain-containing protein [Butyrivibrio sp.]|nr:DUF4358 domain-containing protein [Butyrivibrio sp.]